MARRLESESVSDEVDEPSAGNFTTQKSNQQKRAPTQHLPKGRAVEKTPSTQQTSATQHYAPKPSLLAGKSASKRGHLHGEVSADDTLSDDMQLQIISPDPKRRSEKPSERFRESTNDRKRFVASEVQPYERKTGYERLEAPPAVLTQPCAAIERPEPKSHSSSNQAGSEGFSFEAQNCDKKQNDCDALGYVLQGTLDYDAFLMG